MILPPTRYCILPDSVYFERQVLTAYLVGDVETLRRSCRDAAYGMLHKSIMEREAHQMVMDKRILYMSEPELEALRFVGAYP